MKRFAFVVMISLVMCLNMAFPASALTYIEEHVYGTSYLNKLTYEEISRRINDSSAALPAGYDYMLVLINKDAVKYSFIIYFSNTPTITSSTTIYGHNGHGLGSGQKITFSYNSIQSQGPIYTGGGYYLGYLVNYSTALPSNISSIASSSLAAGRDIEYYLLEVVDVTALQALISTAKAKNDTGYSGTSWQALQNEITAAENLLSATGYTQEQIDNAKNALQAALDDLRLLPDISSLQDLISDAQSISGDGYDFESWQALQTAILSAQAFCSGDDYTAAQLEDEISRLQAAINGLALIPSLPDTSELSSMLVEADRIEDTGYTAESWTRFDNARTAGHELLSRDTYTQPEVSAVTTELSISMYSLTLVAAPLGYDLITGDISGFLAPAYPIFSGYVTSLYPVLMAFLAIMVGIRIIPVVFEKVFRGYRR